MTGCVHIKGSLGPVGIPLSFEACIELAAGPSPAEELVRAVMVTFDRSCAPAAYVRFLEEAEAESWCAAIATRLALDAYLSRVRKTTAGTFTPPPLN